MRSLYRYVIALVFSAAHIVTLLWCCFGELEAALGRAWEAWSDMSAADIAALVLPVLSMLLFWRVHRLDEKRRLGGVKHRSDGGRRSWGFADSAISRLSIHAGIGIGLIAVLMSSSGIWQNPAGTHAGDRTVIAASAVAALASSTLLCLVAVLCYAQSKRWEKLQGEELEPDVKHDLLMKASSFDQSSWYVFMIGLVWTVAIAHPALGILANFAYGAALYRYYFRWGKPTTVREIIEDLTKEGWQDCGRYRAKRHSRRGSKLIAITGADDDTVYPEDRKSIVKDVGEVGRGPGFPFRR